MGTGWFVGFFTVAIPEAASRLLFCADVDDSLLLFALAMPLGSCGREKRLFGI